MLGIDPGLATLGYGAVEGLTDPVSLGWGVIKTPAKAPIADRLQTLYDGTIELIDRFDPSVMAVEKLFFARNVTTAMAVGQARGVVLLAAAQKSIPIDEYAPSEIKQAVTGYGNAEKAQIQQMVAIILGLDEIPRPDDAADAVAAAICCLNTRAGRNAYR